MLGYGAVISRVCFPAPDRQLWPSSSAGIALIGFICNPSVFVCVCVAVCGCVCVAVFMAVYARPTHAQKQTKTNTRVNHASPQFLSVIQCVIFHGAFLDEDASKPAVYRLRSLWVYSSSPDVNAFWKFLSVAMEKTDSCCQ